MDLSDLAEVFVREVSQILSPVFAEKQFTLIRCSLNPCVVQYRRERVDVAIIYDSRTSEVDLICMLPNNVVCKDLVRSMLLLNGDHRRNIEAHSHANMTLAIEKMLSLLRLRGIDIVNADVDGIVLLNAQVAQEDRIFTLGLIDHAALSKAEAAWAAKNYKEVVAGYLQVKRPLSKVEEARLVLAKKKLSERRWWKW